MGIGAMLGTSGDVAALEGSLGEFVIRPPNDPVAYVCQMYAEHPGGANVSFGDGSVRFIADSINHDVWAAACSRNGGEVARVD